MIWVYFIITAAVTASYACITWEASGGRWPMVAAYIIFCLGIIGLGYCVIKIVIGPDK